MSWTPRWKTYLILTACLGLNEAASFLGYLHPRIGALAFILLCLTTLVLSWRRIEVGILLLLAELFVGGKGYLFSLAIGGLTISIRHALFVVLITTWLIRFGRHRDTWPRLTRQTQLWILGLVAVLTLGVVLGLIDQHGFRAVFFDANAFLFLGLGLVLVSPRLDWSWLLPRLMALIAAAATILGLKSLLALGLFVHLSVANLKPLYKWIRDTGVGEVAPIFGGTYRVFLQSQIYGLLSTAVLAILLLPTNRPTGHRPWWLIVPVTLGVAAVLVSLSRSFWIGAAAALIAGAGVGWRWYRWNGRQLFGILGMLLLVGGLAYTLNSWALNFPYPFRFGGGRDAGSVLNQRFTDLGGESAARSRSELFRALIPVIERRPIFGYGFGKTITYQSSDPRQLQSPSHGRYTTYAFELGYLDLAVKLGLVGLAVVAGCLAGIMVALWRRRTALSYGFLVGTVALATIHLTTPYINHPLGIGFLLLAFVATVIPVQQES